jgi:excisionase family DNA binding protein
MLTRHRNTTPKPFLSVEETAILLGETRSTVYRAVKAGTFPLPVLRIGSRIRIPRSAVERLIAGVAPEESVPSGRLAAWRASADGPPTAASSRGH